MIEMTKEEIDFMDSLTTAEDDFKKSADMAHEKARKVVKKTLEKYKGNDKMTKRVEDVVKIITFDLDAGYEGKVELAAQFYYYLGENVADDLILKELGKFDGEMVVAMLHNSKKSIKEYFETVKKDSFMSLVALADLIYNLRNIDNLPEFNKSEYLKEVKEYFDEYGVYEQKWIQKYFFNELSKALGKEISKDDNQD